MIKGLHIYRDMYVYILMYKLMKEISDMEFSRNSYVMVIPVDEQKVIYIEKKF